mmetsp:Transcript_9041/g.10221  ORF Transcript_9041/g.10221 Transcript_9041/m.10221 type:complete len:159 (+) Transcript_9041:30-506(+)
MFTYSRTDKKDFRVGKVLGGAGLGDNHSYRILYAGPDPADRSRILVKKIFRTSDNGYFYEDVRFNVKDKTVHSQAHSYLHDLKEHIENEEIKIRVNLRAHSHILGFSVYWRQLASGKNHMSIIESHNKAATVSWSSCFKTFFARRDAYNYLKNRWTAH